jgi:hypothetical protein
MPATNDILQRYLKSSLQDERALLARYLLRLAPNDDAAMSALLVIVNDENDSDVRLDIVRFLAAKRPLSAVHALAKEMFDPDPRVRAQAAIGIAGYDDARVLAGSVASILNALEDGSTRSYAATAIYTVSGRTPDKITHSERDRIRRGESAEMVWPDHYYA